MRTGSRSIKLLLALACCAALPVQAKVLTAKIARITTGAGTLQDVRVTLDWPLDAASGTLRLRAGRLDFPALSYRARDVDWRCPLSRLPNGKWRCAGPVSAAGTRRAQQLALEFSPDGTSAVLGVSGSSIAYRSAPSRPGVSSVQLQQVPVGWLKAYLAGLWPAGRWTGGRMDGSVDVITTHRGTFQVRTDLRLAGVGLETPDGLLAGDRLKGRLKLDYQRRGALTRVDTALTLAGGEFLLGSLYAKLPASPVTVHVLARRNGAAPWRLDEMSWRDAGVLSATGNATLDANSSITDTDIKLSIADLSVARDRYLSGFLAPAGFSDVLLSGTVAADLRMHGGEFASVQARLDGIDAVDPKARFTFAGIAGDLVWTRAAAALPGKLKWNNAALFGIGLGPASFPTSSSNGELRLDSATAIEALEGKLVLNHLRWQAPRATSGARVAFGMDMQSMDLASLSQRLGWPAFTGTVSGRIPEARLENDMLTMDGGLQMAVFGGQIDVQHLSMERPFGVAPSLSADVRIEDVDLEPMTKVFGFGSITGRLDGRIDKLRLVDWSATAFDAHLETDKAWKGKRRISQRAIKNISEVGGGGLGAGLQAQALKFFDEFSYDRIGISCKLQDEVCTMDGVGSAGEGYIIVAGAGLPRIQVVGFRRKVDWPTLVARLQAATQGQAPIIK